MAPVKRTFEQADQSWTNEQALASDLGYAVGDEQFPCGTSGNSAGQPSASDPHSSSLRISTDEYSPDDVEEGPAVQQAVQSGLPAKRPRKARRKKSDPPPDYSAAVQRNMTELSRTAQACDRYRVTRRPIERGYLERVESYAHQNYLRYCHLQGLLAATWDYANVLGAHNQQLSNIVTHSGLPHPPLHIPDNLWRTIHEFNTGAAFAPLNPPPTPPPIGRTSEFLSQGNIPPTVQVPVVGPGPAMVNQPFQHPYPATSSQPPGAVSQSARRSVKRQQDPRRNHSQRPSAGYPAMAAPSRAPSAPSVNVNTAYPNVQVQGVPPPQNPTTRPPTCQPTVQRSVHGTSANRGVELAHAPYNAAGISTHGPTNRAGQRPSRGTRIETIDLTGEEDDSAPQGLGDVYPAPPGNHAHPQSTGLQDFDGFHHLGAQSGHIFPVEQRPVEQNLATNILQGPSGQPNFPLPPQHGDDTINPSVLMPAWLSYGLDDLGTGVQAGTDDTAPFLDSERHNAPEGSVTGAQGSAPAAEAATVDHDENPGHSQPLDKAPSSSPLDFSFIDMNFDDLPVPDGSFDLEIPADLESAVTRVLGADANPVQSPQPPAAVHVVVPASIPASPEPDSVARLLAEFPAAEPAVAEPQVLLDPPTGSLSAGSAHADDADSLFEGSLGISPSSAGGSLPSDLLNVQILTWGVFERELI
ncbi:hypothetical protein BJX96DRAFT_176687 [Aspergillus floccosus]